MAFILQKYWHGLNFYISAQVPDAKYRLFANSPDTLVNTQDKALSGRKKRPLGERRGSYSEAVLRSGSLGSEFYGRESLNFDTGTESGAV